LVIRFKTSHRLYAGGINPSVKHLWLLLFVPDTLPIANHTTYDN